MQFLDQKGVSRRPRAAHSFGTKPGTTCARVPAAKMWLPAARHNPARSMTNDDNHWARAPSARRPARRAWLL